MSLASFVVVVPSSAVCLFVEYVPSFLAAAVGTVDSFRVLKLAEADDVGSIALGDELLSVTFLVVESAPSSILFAVDFVIAFVLRSSPLPSDDAVDHVS